MVSNHESRSTFVIGPSAVLEGNAIFTNFKGTLPPFSFRTSLAAANDGAAIKDIPLYAFGPAARLLALEKAFLHENT